MAAFFTVYTLLNSNQNVKLKNLKEQASTIQKQIASGDSQLKITNQNEINISKLNQLKNLSYTDLKSQMGIGGDFCIYLEDDKGNVVIMNNSYKGIGSSNIFISDTPCSQK